MQFQTRVKFSQGQWIVMVVLLTLLLATFILWFKPKPEAEDGHDHAEAQNTLQTNQHAVADNAEHDGHTHERDPSVILTPQQMTQQGIQIATVGMGEVSNYTQYPARLTANTDRQAHVASIFAGRVERVNVDLGQSVKKGQALATLLIPDLVDQQANLRVAQSNLALARQEYQREKTLWSQGISAQQDYQRARNAYQQAQIQVQAAQSRLNAYGAEGYSNGRYVLTAPISGVISQKDIVVGENIQLATQLFVIDQLDQLWLEFIVPSDPNLQLLPEQKLSFKSLQTQNSFQAQIQTLSTEADAQTGRLQVRAKVLSTAQELRPNLLVNIAIPQRQQQTVLRVQKTALQQLDTKTVVFVVRSKGEQMEFSPQVVRLGQSSADGQWVEIKQGLSQAQRYVTQGSFLLKSELEKGEAAHEH